MKVCFLIKGFSVPSSRVRIVNLVSELEKYGIDCNIYEYPRSLLEKIKVFSVIRRFDLIYIQKCLPSVLEAFVLKKISKKIIYDFDDAIFTNQDVHEIKVRSSRYIKFKTMLKISDVVVAGNSYLAEEALKHNAHVLIIPSAVEIEKNEYEKRERNNTTVVIGWVGTDFNLPYLSEISNVIRRISLEHSIVLRIICNCSIEIPQVHVEFIPWKLETQDVEITQFDIGIMPLPDNVHTRGKCGYKALQYMSLGVPPVVSDVGVNREIVDNGNCGVAVKTEEEFYLALKALVEDKEMRLAMGLRARRRVQDHYSVEVIGKRLAEVLLSSHQQI